MRNMLPMIVGAVVVGGGVIAIYNATGGKNDPMSQSPPPAAATQAVVSPASAGTNVEVPKPAATFSKIDIASDETILGKIDAPVTIVEYASMTCPHCARFHNTVLPTIKSEFIDKGQVRLVFRDFPLDNLASSARRRFCQWRPLWRRPWDRSASGGHKIQAEIVVIRACT